MRRPTRRYLASLAALLLPATALAAGDDHWPQWRGPHGTGVAATDAPTTWSDEENVKWTIPIPGRGFSTPVVWGNYLFLTTAVSTSADPDVVDEPPQREEGGRGGRGRGGPGRGAAPSEHDFLALCLDRRTGEVLWERVLATATPHESFHRSYGSYASISPVTDGERVYFSFGSLGIHCLDMSGKEVWTMDPKVKMTIRAQFGEGASPALVGNTLVHLYDHEGDSFMVALDKRDGKELWRVARDEATTWSAPLPLVHDGRAQIVTSGSNKVRAYAPETGASLWECGGLGTNPVPVPMLHGDTVLTMSGHRNIKLMAIALDGEGDVTDTEAVRWSATRGVPYTSTPVLYDGLLYTITDRGQISCFDATTGEAHYLEERLPRGSQLKASPVVAGGKLYIPTEDGDVHVIATGTEYKVLGTNTLTDQFFVASPVVVAGEMFLRSRENLYCIADLKDGKK